MKNKGTYHPWVKLVCTSVEPSYDARRSGADASDNKPCGGESFSCDGSFHWDEGTQEWESGAVYDGKNTCNECGEEGDVEEVELTFDEIAEVLRHAVAAHASHPYKPCDECGQLEHYQLLDQRDDNQPHWFCIRCYGPGWAPSHAHSIGKSRRPDLLPLYLDWLKGAMVRAKIMEAVDA